MPETRRNPDDLQQLQFDKGAPARRRTHRWRKPALIVLVICVVAATLAQVLAGRADAGAEQTAKVSRVSALSEFEITTANGYVTPRRRAAVASKIQGRLAAMLTDEGDLVREGQVLAEVEHREEDAMVAQAQAGLSNATSLVTAREALLREAQAGLGTAQATLDERKATRTLAEAWLTERKTTLARTEDLVRGGISNQAQLDAARRDHDVAYAQFVQAETALTTANQAVAQAEAAVTTAQAQLAASRAQIEGSKAEVARAEAIRDNAFIKAPFAGTILRREAEPGEVVSPANTGASGSKTAVVTMADFASLEVEVDVYERDIARVEKDTRCRILLDAYPDQPLAGKVRLVRPTADRSKATIKVVAVFDTVPAFARPEMGARVTFLAPGGEPLAADRIVVDAKALVTQDGREGVFVIEGKEKRFVTVEAGATKDGKVQIKQGLAGGETVLLR